MREELWLLPSHRPDPRRPDLGGDRAAASRRRSSNGFHIVLANKKPLAVPQIEFDG